MTENYSSLKHLKLTLRLQPTNMVTIYSTPTCVYCKSLKEYLSEKNIVFQEIDVSENEKELEKMVAISGQMGVPVVEIEGNVVIGFDREKIDEILKLK